MFLPLSAGFGPHLGPQRPSKYEARLASKNNVALAEHGDRRYRTGSIASTLTKRFSVKPQVNLSNSRPNRWTSG